VELFCFDRTTIVDINFIKKLAESEPTVVDYLEKVVENLTLSVLDFRNLFLLNLLDYKVSLVEFLELLESDQTVLVSVDFFE
jgi:hypothetical protein